MTAITLTPSIGSGRELALALGWSDADVRDKTITQGGTCLDVARTYIAGEPAGVFAIVRARNGFDPVDSAALYGYHVANEWGLVADPATGLTLFNARWSDEGRWYKWPSVPWPNVRAMGEVLQALTPQGLIEGRLAVLAEQTKKPSSLLVPVDDALVERLDRWRDETLRFSEVTTNTDEQLQHLYAQLFVLRTVEDRALNSSVPSLKTTINKKGEIDRRRWTSLMRAARLQIGGELFANDVSLNIPPHVVVGVVRDLYQPRQLPDQNSQYNFSWMDADVLGMAYEKYLASVLQPGAPALQIDMFNTTERDVERVSVRKKKGVYYTPTYITNYLATKTVDDYFLDGAQNAPPFIIDFACGSGAFLVAAVDRILHYLKQRDPKRSWARELIQERHIAGIDFDSKAVELARLRVWQRLLEEPDALPLPSLADVVATGDGLRQESWGSLTRKYDIVLGNPPFLATGKVEARETLETRFETAKGRYDYSSLFVEQGIRVLTPRGRLGMVVPNRLFRNTSGGTLRDFLVRQTQLLTIVDFGATRPFEAYAYIGCIVAEKRDAGSSLPRHVKVLDVDSIEREFLAGLLLAADHGEQVSGIKSFEARHPTGSAPWILLSERDQVARIQLEDASVRLDSVALIAQGIRTGANDIFIFELLSDDGTHLCEVINGLGERLILERELLEPVVHGSEVQRFSRVRAHNRLLYPHRNGVPLSEAELIKRYPRTWDYLLANRTLLASRSTVIRSNGRFFELAWPRDEAWLRRPKLLIRDLAPRTSFAIDDEGAVFLVGGTAVAPYEVDTLGSLLAYLNSSFVNEHVRQSTPSFQSDYQKFEPKHLQGIPILRRFVEDERFQRTLGDLAWSVVAAQANSEATAELEKRIDNLIWNAVREARTS